MEIDRHHITIPEQHTAECLEYSGKTGKNYCIASCYDKRFETPEKPTVNHPIYNMWYEVQAYLDEPINDWFAVLDHTQNPNASSLANAQALYKSQCEAHPHDTFRIVRYTEVVNLQVAIIAYNKTME